MVWTFFTDVIDSYSKSSNFRAIMNNDQEKLINFTEREDFD